MAQRLPRGLRNNNPLNLRKSDNKWQGKVYPGTDKAFEQFVNVLYGIRAAMVSEASFFLYNQTIKQSNKLIQKLSEIIKKDTTNAERQRKYRKTKKAEESQNS